MADSKITALTAISTVDPAADPLVIVDVSDTSMAASGTTKKATINQLLGASGTATLASATITGDLTVDTSTLKVDSANNRVGVLNAAPNDTFTIASDNYLSFQTASTGFNSGRAARIGAISAGSGNGYLVFETYQGGSGGAERYRIASDGVATWSNVGGVAGTAMTLNSNGLGVGVSPGYKLDVVSSLNTIAKFTSSTSSGYLRFADSTAEVGYLGNGSGVFAGAARTDFGISSLGSLVLGSNNARAVTIDTSGNVGIGVASPATKLDVAGNARVQLAFFTGGSIPGLTNDNPFAYRFPGGGLGLGAATETGTASPIIFYTGQGGVERVRVKGSGQVRFFPLAADPAGAEAGDVYYNSTSNKLKCYNGTTWNDLF